MPAWLHTSLNITALVFMLISLAGLIVPIYPGLVIIWGVMLAHEILTGFAVSWWTFGFATVLMIVGSLADNVLMGTKARQGGASWWSIFAALTAALVASFFFTPLAGLLAAPLTLLGLEYLRTKDKRQAWQTTKSLLNGWGQAFIVRFILGILMILAWALSVW